MKFLKKKKGISDAELAYINSDKDETAEKEIAGSNISW
jgi:hypothetical protein